MAGSSEPAFYLGAKKGAIAQSPIYFLVILRQPLYHNNVSIWFLKYHSFDTIPFLISGETQKM